MYVLNAKVPTSCGPVVLDEKVKCKKDACVPQNPIRPQEKLILYLLICPLRKKNHDDSKCFQNGFPSFWIQYEDEDKSRCIASHQLALLLLCTLLTEYKSRNRSLVDFSYIWALSSLAG